MSERKREKRRKGVKWKTEKEKKSEKIVIIKIIQHYKTLEI